MFYLFAIVSMLGYAVQGVATAGFYRKDPLGTSTMRGLSLGISMLPLLLFVPVRAYGDVIPLFPGLVLACCAAAIANVLQGIALRHLPVGIMGALVNVAIVLGLVMMAFVIEHERLAPVQYFCVALILGTASWLMLLRSGTPAAHPAHPMRGALAALLGGVVLAAAFFAVVRISKQSHPFLAAYLWEFGIGLVSLPVALLTRRRPTAIPLRQFPAVLLASSGTAIGTGLYAYASTIGSVSIVAAVNVSGVMVVTLFSVWVYGERLRLVEWIATASVAGAIVALRLSGT